MRKLLFGAVALLLMASCAGNGGSEKAGTDSSQTTDSPVQTEVAAKAEAEQARQDSIRQDSITKAEKAAKEEKAASQYDDLVNQYVACINKLDKAGRNGEWKKVDQLTKKHYNLQVKINKVKTKLSPEQKAKVKKAEKKYNLLLSGIIAG